MQVISKGNIATTHAAPPSLSRFIVSEMIKPSIRVPTEGYFSGGVGEAQFSSFLANEYANRIASKINR